MMKSVTITLQQLIHNYNTAMVDMVLDDRGDSLCNAASTAEDYLRDLRNLIAPKRSLVVNTLRNLFGGGFTMLLLSTEQFNFLDACAQAEDEFSIVVKEQDETICILCQNEIAW